MKIVVDLNKQQIIEAPGSGLELVVPTQENYADEGEILLRHTITDAEYLKYYTRLAETFTDAEGNVHKRAIKTTSAGNFGGYMTSKDGTAVDEMRYTLERSERLSSTPNDYAREIY